MDRQRVSFKMGQRLKELREESGLSHVDLMKQLNDKYGVSISRDSLMAYEISDERRAKASKLPNLGMRVEYLYCLADFFGVSIDYLLGLSDEQAINGDLAQASRYTGLCASAISKLHESLESSYAHSKILLLVIEQILQNRTDDFMTWTWRAAMARCCPKISIEEPEFAEIRHCADMRLVEAANAGMEGVPKTVEVPIVDYEDICTSTAVGIIRKSTEAALEDFKRKFAEAFEQEKDSK